MAISNTSEDPLLPDIEEEEPLEQVKKERDFWQSMFQSLVENAPTPILVTDNEERITHWNEACVEFTGLSQSDAIGTAASEFVVDDGEEFVVQPAVRHDEPAVADKRTGEYPDGSTWTTKDVGVPLEGPDGEVVGGIEYVVEITEVVDELHTLMKDVEHDLATPIDELTESANEVSGTAREIHTVIEEQTEALDTAAGEISDMSAAIEEVASTSERVVDRSQRSEALAEDGRDAAMTAIDRMEEIDSSVETVRNDMDGLQARMQDVADFTEIIEDIAEQTNLLALNASIEAARAGEEGDGFAVVASEIKSLANESGENATEIEATIESAQTEMNETVESLQAVSNQVEQGITDVQQTVEHLGDIVEAARKTAEGIQDVARSTDDQASGVEEVASMVDNLVDKLAEIRIGVNEVAEATENQTEQIQEISDTTARLTATQ
ncbi:PAS domain S-box protein [Salinadaptatus halalkaliphilus]|uniref:PAS domain S-box protein n=1 Tax=Salinadaptatus halalkaliphilus TaxID=2419781 RepID=A0A4S3TNU9_9EURY|nr:methyl-accepting chemotaxis protein [Salinadaptatus halalkaliphilus]THE65951.1 PAS domain S-box protein [Salinadaptatus halalkaliphilus]